MNLPNKLTLIRILMIPLFVALYYIPIIPFNFSIAAVIFALAAFTDFLDGYIARKYNIVTDLGKFLDPIADKVLVASALIIMLVPVGDAVILPDYAGIAVAIILARELVVSGFRMVASSKGMVIAADKSGKIKTFVTDIAIFVLLIGADITPNLYGWANICGLVIFGVATILTVISGAECIIKNKDVLKEKKEEKKEVK